MMREGSKGEEEEKEKDGNTTRRKEAMRWESW
jgi:hypothetical protein